MHRFSFRSLTCVLCTLVAVLTATWMRGPTGADGSLLDRLVAIHALVWPEAPVPSPPPVAVIALDRRSLDAPELAPYPRTFLAPVWATLLEAVFTAGARAVGFDFLFSYSANRFVSDFDQPFLSTLGRYRDRIVLARSTTTLPAAPFLAALRNDPAALGLVELTPDSDGRYRHIRASYPTSAGEPLEGFTSTLLRRAQAPPMPSVVVLTPRRHLESQIPTYAVIDVLRCAQQAPAVLRAVFDGTIILIGSMLVDEDRWVSSGRFLTPQQTPASPMHPCGVHRLGASAPRVETVPGVFLHAAAVEAVVRGRLTTTAPTAVIVGMTAGTAAFGALLGLLIQPWLTLAVIGGMALLYLAIATVLLHTTLWLPLVLPLSALVVTPLLAYVVRYLAEERHRRRLERAFGYYLAPAIVARLEGDAAALRLGGERREVTVMFADLSGFTALSGQVEPEVLMRVTNQYLGYIVEQVEATGGYVDKFIGDGVLALWGAPAPDPQHAIHGVQAALAVVVRLSHMRQIAAARQQISFGVKIGVNSGIAMVGNVGTKGRYNYTAVGETVNVAARLEGVPELYACQVVVGPETAMLLQKTFLLCELDTIRVKGKETPLTIFAPLATLATATEAQRAYARGFATALAHYRARQFAAAASLWAALPPTWQGTLLGRPDAPAPLSHPAAIMAQRARVYATAPPSLSWDSVWELTTK